MGVRGGQATGGEVYEGFDDGGEERHGVSFYRMRDPRGFCVPAQRSVSHSGHLLLSYNVALCFVAVVPLLDHQHIAFVDAVPSPSPLSPVACVSSLSRSLGRRS